MTGVIDGLALRPVTADEFDAYARAVELPFFEHPNAEEIGRWRSVTELDRTLAVFDGNAIIGTAGAFSFRLSVPGGDVPMAGVTAVGVRPTHRRRGVLRAMMRHQLDDVAERGEPLAGLFATESVIYGRFGYGIAAPAVFWTLERAHAAFVAAARVERGVELLDAEQAVTVLPATYDAARRQRPGMPDRSPQMWQMWLGHDPENERDGASRRFHARLADRGYVIYRVKRAWEQGLPKGTLQVLEHVATDPVAASTLWRFCFDLDLITSIEMFSRPIDDTLPLLLRDPRRLRSWSVDALWLRLVHLDQALTSRSYAAEGTVVLEVDDSFCPWNSGRWRLSVGADGAACERTADPAELTVSAAALASGWLGTIPLARQVRAGLVAEHHTGAADRADGMFRSDPAPWCPQEF